MSTGFKTNYRGYLIDHHSPDPPEVPLNHLNAYECECFFKEANITNLTLYCKDHWGNSYYNTKVGRKHPGLKDRDWIAEIVPVLRRNNIEFTAYYCFEYDTYAPLMHPDWSVVTKDGIPLKCGMFRKSSIAKWGIPCLHTPYRKYVIGQLKEIVSNYHPDNLFIDIFGMTLCYCDVCRKIYRDRFGYDIPETDEEMIEKNGDLVAYLDDEAEKMLDEVRNAINEIDNTIALSINFSSHYPKRIRDKLDYMFTEPWAGNWLSGAYARDTSGGKYPQLGCGNVSQVYNYQPESIYELAVAEVAAQGCRVFLYSESMHIDGSLDFEEAYRIGKAYRELEKFESFLSNRQIHADIAIIQSDVSDTLRADQPIKISSIGRAQIGGYHRRALLGAMQMCDYSKRTWRVLPESEVNRELLCSYKMVILPNLFYINDQLKENLQYYVSHGGCLLLSGECGVCNQAGDVLSDFELADLMGCHFIEKDKSYANNTWCAYIRQTDDTIWKHNAATTLPVSSYIIRTQNDCAHIIGDFINPAVHLTDTTWLNWNYPQPGHPNGVTALYENKVDNGTVLTACFDFCGMASQDFIWTKDLMLGIIEKYVRASVVLKTEHMNTLEYICYTREKELLVHELSSMARKTGGDTEEISGGVLCLSDEFCIVAQAKQVYPKCCELAVHHDPITKVTKIELPDVRIHNLYSIILKI